MDKYKIRFVCTKAPGKSHKLVGFVEGQEYSGRHYNGLYEISPEWGRGSRSMLVDQATFTEYFELLALHKTSAA